MEPLDLAAWSFRFAASFLFVTAALKWLEAQQSKFRTAGVVDTLYAFLRENCPAELNAHVSLSTHLLGESSAKVRDVCANFLFTAFSAALGMQAVATLLFGQLVPFAAVATFPVVLGFQALTLRSRGRERMTKVGRDLPGLLNTLNLLLNAGSTLENAIETAVDSYRGTAIGDELGQLVRDRQMGLDRTSAFRALAARVPRDDVRSIAAAIELAERLGTPLAETLERQSNEIMRIRLESASRIAKEAAVKLALPNTLIMIAIALLIGGGMLPNLVRLL
jgi:Flp pilus assembly protein TadB